MDEQIVLNCWVWISYSVKVFYLICLFFLLPIWQLLIWQLHCFLKKKIQEKQVLWTKHRAVWFADKSEACVWSDMHAVGLAADRGRAGHFLGSQSSRTVGSVTVTGEWYHPLKPVSTVSLCLLAGQTKLVILAGVPARGRFGCLWSFCFLGEIVPVPTVATLPQQSDRSCMVSISCLVLSLLPRGSDFLPGKKPFVLVINTKFCLCC